MSEEIKEELSSDELINQHIDGAEKEGQDETPEIEEDKKTEEKVEAGEPDPVEGEKPAAVEETREGDEEKSPEGESKEGEAGEESVEEKEYEPNLSYKHLREEKSLPDELKGVIKTKEQEDFYKEVFTKAEGFNFVQEKRKEAEQQLGQMDQAMNSFFQATGLGDYKKAFEVAGIDKPQIGEILSGLGYSRDDILKHALGLAEQTPEQIQANQAQRQNDMRERELQMREQSIESEHEQVLTNQVRMDYQFNVLNDNDMGPIVRAFDSQHGEGAFFDQLAIQGSHLTKTTGKIYPPAAIAKDLISRYNLGNLVSQTANQMNTSQQSQTAHNDNNQSNQPVRDNVKNEEIPVIPAVEGTGDSPGPRKISSLDDIEREIKELYG